MRCGATFSAAGRGTFRGTGLPKPRARGRTGGRTAPGFVVLLALAAFFTLAALAACGSGGSGSGRSEASQPGAREGGELEIAAQTSFDGRYSASLMEISNPRLIAGTQYLWSVEGAIAVGPAETGGAEAASGMRLVAVFDRAGLHAVTVRALDATKGIVGRGGLTVPVDRAPSGNPREAQWSTLGEQGGLLVLDSPIWSVRGGQPADFPRVARLGGLEVVRALKAGFFELDLLRGSCHVFVSPVPSFHVDRADLDWYLTQFDTETSSNCGPTATAMAILWATGNPIRVVDIRRMVGWEGSGAVSLVQLRGVCRSYGVAADLVRLASLRDLFGWLARGRLVIVSYDMGGVRAAADPAQDLMGQYYTDAGGHYLTLKGFSLDRRWIIVYDPIPSDWAANSRRYGDGSSMYGRNRYYPADELWNALNSREALVVSGGP